MKDYWIRFQQYYEGLAVRERALLACACVAVLYGIVEALILQPLDAERDHLRTQLAKNTEAIDGLNERSKLLAQMAAGNVPSGLGSEQASLNRQIEIMNARIQQRMSSMIPPNEVTRMLEELLGDEGDLTLVKLTSIEPATTPRAAGAAHGGSVATGEQPKTSKPEFYRHGFVIELEGTYLAALHYLESIESLPWDLWWDTMTYEVTEYPRARVSIELHTMSREENWLGV